MAIQEPQVEDFPSIWKRILADEGFQGDVWGAKVDAFCDHLFDGLEHVKIAIWRNREDIAASCLRVLKGHDEATWLRIIQKHHDNLRRLKIPPINTDELVAGNHDSIERAFEACGLTYDRSIAEQVIRA